MKIFAFSKSWLVLFLFLLTSLSYAQKGDPNLSSRNSHFITISLTGGASGFAMMPSVNSIRVENPIDTLGIAASPFLGGSFGIGYEYQSPRGFWVSVGVEGQILTGGLSNTQPIRRIENVMDGNVETGEKNSTLEYTIVKWHERERAVLANLPIMFGYKAESGFYFGLGAKVGYSLYGDIMGDFGFADCNVYYDETMPLPGLVSDINLENVHSFDKNFVGQITAIPAVEIGWQGLDQSFGKGMSMRFKFAIVGEFGAMTIYSNRSSGEALFDYADFDGWRPEKLDELFESVNSFYSVVPLGLTKGNFNSKKGEGYFVDYERSANLYPWFVGVKVGIMFEMPKSKYCNCLQNNVITPWSKKRRDRGVE